MSYHLFLDDERKPIDVTWIELPPLHWEIVRNYNEFVKIITSNGIPKTISFDHDLSQEHYDELLGAYFGCRPLRYHIFKEKTGRDCAMWLAEYCFDKGLDYPIYFVHTMNPIGRSNIISIIESYKKSRM